MTVLKAYDPGAEEWQTVVVGRRGPAGVVQADAPITYDSGTQTVGIDPDGYIAPQDGVVVFDYGTAIPDVRPSGAAVYWRGTAAPGTAIAGEGDLWFDTTGLTS